jgi:excisionase family DNA binding protein
MNASVTPLPTGPQHAERRRRRDTYTVADVAELLNLSLGSTYTAIRNGEIPARRIGNRWVIPKKRFTHRLNHEATNNDYLDMTDEQRAAFADELAAEQARYRREHPDADDHDSA